jgi:imidazolonepropionase
MKLSTRASARMQGQPPLLLTNIGQLLTLSADTPGPRRGSATRDLAIIEDAAVLCGAGQIISVGRAKDALKDPWLKKNSRHVHEIDCRGGVVLPGFVDSHTHPAFAEPRLIDFEQRTSGASYEQITAAGGGIRSSLAAVRNATKKQLTDHVLHALRQMSQQGTTTVEAKSGYGLSAESEIKSLEAIRDAARQWPGTVVATLLAAHTVPPEFKGKRDGYVRLICDEILPAVAGRKLAQFCDVFCETTAFSEAETNQILECAAQHGLAARAHVCQLSEPKRGFIASLLKREPISLDHLDHLSADDVRALAASSTICTLVPASNYFLGLHRYPPARQLIDAGAALALATDFNPGTSPTPSMPFVLSLACTQMKMTPAEAITAATINGAYALGLGDRKGSIEPGKDADLAIFDVRDYREIAYWFGTNLCRTTIAGGREVSNPKP